MGFPLSPLWCHSVFGSAVWCVITLFSKVVMLASRSLCCSRSALTQQGPFILVWGGNILGAGAVALSLPRTVVFWYFVGHERDLYCFILYCKIKQQRLAILTHEFRIRCSERREGA